jgi:hypothetical protein
MTDVTDFMFIFCKLSEIYHFAGERTKKIQEYLLSLVLVLRILGPLVSGMLSGSTMLFVAGIHEESRDL